MIIALPTGCNVSFGTQSPMTLRQKKCQHHQSMCQASTNCFIFSTWEYIAPSTSSTFYCLEQSLHSQVSIDCLHMEGGINTKLVLGWMHSKKSLPNIAKVITFIKHLPGRKRRTSWVEISFSKYFSLHSMFIFMIFYRSVLTYRR